jgi:hypothetical protein
LAFADGRDGVDGANAGDDPVGDVFAVERAAGSGIEAVMRGGTDGRFAVDRTAETIQDAVQQIGSNGYLRG